MIRKCNKLRPQTTYVTHGTAKMKQSKPMRGSRKFCSEGVQLNFDGFFGLIWSHGGTSQRQASNTYTDGRFRSGPHVLYSKCHFDIEVLNRKRHSQHSYITKQYFGYKRNQNIENNKTYTVLYSQNCTRGESIL